MKLTGKLRYFGLAAMIAGGIWGGSAQAEEAGGGGKPLGAAVASAQQDYAKGVSIAPFTLNGVQVSQNRNGEIPDAFKDPAALLCKPFCVQPEKIDGSDTFMVEDFTKHADAINSGSMLIVDMRTDSWFAKGTLPGSVNLPYSDLTGAKTKAKAKMRKLGGKDIVAFCNGWWCGQSPTGIKALTGLNYPGKIYYFRGGVQDWVDAGLPLSTP
ncbi:Rhodanese domain protein [Magnetococcus marinus MC-1]|uniref:Rhodanese domain protein n=1 Tax=Magnetococcus marinus (strain ATCC BAA-1437 / JCM 17883 / MC-1) TaxID=156889 RepID=A0L8W8_MAGMM|nr:rhodanese-like domain-containing protein [Magnetococcus marinus]ABK44411.1 Rhodanese domain protein [Magnetococcus marinus MC-1]